jgi:hypothetical protein
MLAALLNLFLFFVFTYDTVENTSSYIKGGTHIGLRFTQGTAGVAAGSSVTT